jgi:hypothetical protein
MKKEYLLALIGGLLLLSYVLEAVINPLQIDLATPYDYLKLTNLMQFPFTSAIIFIRALAVFLIPLFLASFVKKAYTVKAIALLILAGLTQLYSLQNVINKTTVVPLEWALSLSLAGIAWLIPACYYFLKSFFSAMQQSLVKSMKVQAPPGQTDTPPDWLSKE